MTTKYAIEFKSPNGEWVRSTAPVLYDTMTEAELSTLGYTIETRVFPIEASIK